MRKFMVYSSAKSSGYNRPFETPRYSLINRKLSIGFIFICRKFLSTRRIALANSKRNAEGISLKDWRIRANLF